MTSVIRSFAIVVIIMTVICPPKFAQAQNKLGVGFEFGQPTGIGWNYRLNATNALDGSLGFAPDDRYRIHMDYLWHSYPFDEKRLSLHYGPGVVFEFGRTRFDEFEDRTEFLGPREAAFGIRGVFGLTYSIAKSPIDLFIEAAPLIIFAPASATDVDAAFGVRFYP